MKPSRLFLYSIVVLILATPTLAGPCPDSQQCAADAGWEGSVNSLLNRFFQCKGPVDDRSPCNYFSAQALEAIYGNDDFRSDSKTSPYLSANEIADFVEANPAIWQALGEATDAAVLAQAQDCANGGRPVVAVKKQAGNGHVALVIPGKAVKVGSWKMEAPCSASFFLDKPANAYVGCPLSYAFEGEAKGIELYCRL